MTRRGIARDSISKEKNDISGFKALLNYGKSHQRELWGYIAMLGFSSAFLMYSSYLLGVLIETISELGRQDNLERIVLFAGLFIAVETLSFFLRWRGSLGMVKTSIGIIHTLRIRLFSKLSSLPMSYFDSQPVGRTVTRLTSDVQGIESFFANGLFRILRSGIQVIMVLVAMLILSPKLGAMVVASSLPALLLNIFAKNLTVKWMREIKTRGARVNSKIAENLNGLAVIKAFGLERWSDRKFRHLLERHLIANLRLNNVNSLVRPLTVVLSSIPSVLALVMGGALVMRGQLELAVFVAYLRYTELFLTPIRIISYEIQQIQNAFSSAERVKNLLEETTEDKLPGLGGALKKTPRGGIVFENVTLSYDGEHTVLDGVSFEIAQSEKIGIVGRTGSGKTSAVSLLAMLYPLAGGRVLFDGLPTSELCRKNLRQQVGFVGQDSIMFRGTIRENLLCAAGERQALSDHEILKQAEKTGLMPLIQKRNEGLDFEILDNGINLSVGEKQLINLTRILIRDPSILILDEATANTDHITEDKIHKAVGRVMENRTCIIIAHRLSTIKDCDRILVFEAGKIVEQGSHQELLDDASGNMIYKQLVRHQLDLPLPGSQ